ncbi:MAG: hypothetical protein J0J05_06070 [Microbacterium sp.]|uniref:hypothetical protein n=1 Tax=Microbacterium sp. TaxID=51671 RepID=UPI001AD24134|nr:hypothetical protein [Microbacterium sp.]MBN9153532.1 hypothetical protein [Microbacterium sp.]MBN9190470.1 hypothetical protein [Microbacterium sp.]
MSTKWRTFDMKPGRGSLSFDLKVVRVIEAHLRTEPPSQGERLRMPPVVEVVFDIQSDHAQLELGLAAEDADRVECALTGGKRAATRSGPPTALASWHQRAGND